MTTKWTSSPKGSGGFIRDSTREWGSRGCGIKRKCRDPRGHFSHCDPEDLVGLLRGLVGHSTTPERVATCHELWPGIFDKLLPAKRASQPIDGQPADSWEVEQLDEALLPLPPDNLPWPTDATSSLLWTWVKAFADRPGRADHVIDVLNRYGWLVGPAATGAVLVVLGTDAAAIARQSRKVVGWMRLLLTQHPEAAGGHRASIQSLLDQLAAGGREGAVELQRELEA